MSAVLDGRTCTALLDTGSMVSTISAGLAQELQLEVAPLEGLLRVEGAGGHSLQYLGYVEARTELPGFAPLDALFLVMPDTAYHGRVPVLLGTNVLSPMMLSADGTEEKDVPLACRLTYQSLVQQQKIDGKTGSVGSVRTTKRVVVPPDSKVMVRGITRAAAGACMRMRVLVDEPQAERLPGGLVVSPGLLHLSSGKSAERCSVEIVNLSGRAVTIPAKSSLGDLYSVSVVPASHAGTEAPDTAASMRVAGEPLSQTRRDTDVDAFLQQFDEALQQHLSSDQVSEVQTLLRRWTHVFSLHDLDLGHAPTVKHHIRLNDNTPFKERTRRIPPAMIEEVREHLQEMLDLGVIRRSESPYASNVVLVKKKDGTLRFCIDLRRLNNLTVRDVYALPRIDDTLDALGIHGWTAGILGM